MPAMRIAAALSLLSMTSACAQEPGCAFTGATIYPEIEAAEVAFLAGNYEGFVGLVAAGMPQLDAAALIAPLQEAVPNGFASCTTILQREDVGGLVQELTVFTAPEGAGLVVLYTQSALVDGSRRILQFSFDTDLNKMMLLLK
ncbi:MAG: hypothetical protein ACRCS3_12695 [Paracoccaceae bacterium]